MKRKYQNPIAEIERFKLSSITTESTGLDGKGNDVDSDDDE